MTENNPEEINVSNLLILRASALISASFHDLQNFTPAFLVANSVVPGDWSCTHYRRLSRRVEINFDSGFVEWHMSERELRIEMFPEVNWDKVMTGDIPQLIPHFARQFLASVPQIAAPDISFHWEIAVSQPEPSQWIRDRFGPRVLPHGYEISDISASFVSNKDDIQVRVDVELGEDDDESKPSPIILDCFGTPNSELGRSELESETERWPDYAEGVREVLAALLEERT